MYALLLVMAIAILVWNASPLLVALLRISYGKFTWALLWRLPLSIAATVLLRLSCEELFSIQQWLWPLFVPAALLLSLCLPFLYEWVGKK